MTLTLDDVRSKRFRRAGPDKVGYATRDVDDFMDSVEELVAELFEARGHLESQVSALSSGGTPPTRVQVTTGKEASSAVVRLVEMATEQAERLTAEAGEQAAKTLDDARRRAAQVTTTADEQARSTRAEAAQAADQLQSAAAARVADLDRDTERRRVEMHAELERERDALVRAIEQLRAYESAYRTALAAQVRQQLAHLEDSRAEPTDLPLPVAPPVRDGAAGGPAGTAPATDAATTAPGDAGGAPPPQDGRASDTPRLDALLGDSR